MSVLNKWKKLSIVAAIAAGLAVISVPVSAQATETPAPETAVETAAPEATDTPAPTETEAPTDVPTETPAENTDALPIPADEPVKTITNLVIDATVDKAKNLTVKETFTYDFGDQPTDELYQEIRLNNLGTPPTFTVKVDGDTVEEPETVQQSNVWSILIMDNNKQGWTGTHDFEITYTSTLLVNEIQRGYVYDNPEIKTGTTQFFNWEALVPLWRGEIKDLTINLTLPDEPFYVEYYNSTTDTSEIPTKGEGNTYTYTLKDLPPQSNGLTASVQYKNYVFTDPTLVGEAPPTPEPAVIQNADVSQQQSFLPGIIIAGVLIVLGIIGGIMKFSRRNKN
jgi:hypothetical protein